MLVSTRGRYALRIMMELAKYDRNRYIPLPLIAENQEVSEKYLRASFPFWPRRDWWKACGARAGDTA